MNKQEKITLLIVWIYSPFLKPFQRFHNILTLIDIVIFLFSKYLNFLISLIENSRSEKIMRHIPPPFPRSQTLYTFTLYDHFVHPAARTPTLYTIWLPKVQNPYFGGHQIYYFGREIPGLHKYEFSFSWKRKWIFRFLFCNNFEDQ